MISGLSRLFFFFYPRPRGGGRRLLLHRLRGAERISIHALREEGDSTSQKGRRRAVDFYPRPPRGGRR